MPIAWRLELDDLEGPFQPRPFYDSMKENHFNVRSGLCSFLGNRFRYLCTEDPRLQRGVCVLSEEFRI